MPPQFKSRDPWYKALGWYAGVGFLEWMPLDPELVDFGHLRNFDKALGMPLAACDETPACHYWFQNTGFYFPLGSFQQYVDCIAIPI